MKCSLDSPTPCCCESWFIDGAVDLVYLLAGLKLSRLIFTPATSDHVVLDLDLKQID